MNQRGSLVPTAVRQVGRSRSIQFKLAEEGGRLWVESIRYRKAGARIYKTTENMTEC